jgi:hypothetical protein
MVIFPQTVTNSSIISHSIFTVQLLDFLFNQFSSSDCRGKRLGQVVALSPGEAIFRAVGSSVMVMPYAIMPKNMCQNIKYNIRYDCLSIALTYMPLATLYVGRLRMVKLLECFTISSQTMASKYAHGLLFYCIVAC